MSTSEIADIVARFRHKERDGPPPPTALLTLAQAAKVCASYGMASFNYRWWRRTIDRAEFPSTMPGGRYLVRRDYVEALCRHYQIEAS
jgi:hypothetical protein